MLSRAEKIEKLRLLTRKRFFQLGTFIPTVSTNYSEPRHLQPLLALLARARRGEAVRAVVSTPPRHTKTETVLHYFAQALALDGRKTHAYVTYSDRLTKSKSRKARRYAIAANVPIAEDQAALNEWRTVYGGGLLATSIGGSFTGQGVDGTLVVDDPLKGRREAESELIRETTWEWFNDVAYTRLQPGASAIVIATRWHQDDLSGRLLAQRGKNGKPLWEHINLPAVDDDGNALWPDQYPLELLEEIRAQVGEYTWWSLYQGKPRPRGGQLFTEPAVYDEPNLSNARIVIGVDPAASKKTHADYSVAVVQALTGYGISLRSDVLEVIRMQKSIPELVKKLLDLQAKWAQVSVTAEAPLVIEAVAGFKSVPQMLLDIEPRLNIVEVHPDKDKFIRAQPFAAAWNRGRVRVPKQAPWVTDYKREHLSFTGVNDVHDDQVDASAHGWNHEREHVGVGASYSPPEPGQGSFGTTGSSADERIKQRVAELSGWADRRPDDR